MKITAEYICIFVYEQFVCSMDIFNGRFEEVDLITVILP